MQISAKVDYAVRAMLELAELQAQDQDSVMTADSIAKAQAVPFKFLEGILRDLRRAGFVATTRGPEGGYRLATNSEDISVADVIRAIDGPLAEVRGEKPEDAKYFGASEHLGDVWIAVRASLRSVLETTYLSDLADGKLSPQVLKSLKDPEAWTRR
jgi:Rrf2 family protein